MRAGINLASRPFVNDRPVARVTAALWVLGALLALAAGWSFWGYFAGREDQREELASIEAAMEREREAIVGLSRELAAIPLDNQNQRVRFLNQRIAERAFSWSLLFDRLAEILPADVRLLSLAPRVEFGEDGRRRGRAAAADEPAPGERVLLQVQAAARRQEAILELLDALFASDSFERPNLAQESREGGETRFTLSVVYLPDAAAEDDGAVAGEAATDGGGDGGAAGDAAEPAAETAVTEAGGAGETAVTEAEAAEAGGTA
jgi:Tfp pilus assembly protein PilN